MKYPCPHCGQRLESGASIAGERIDCPACGKSLVTPAARGAESVPENASRASRGGPDPWAAPGVPQGSGAPLPGTARAGAQPADEDKPVDESGATIVEHEATRQSAIHRSEMTISGFMAEHGLDGGGVNLDSAGSSAAQMLNAEDGRRYDMGEVVAEGGMGAIIDARDRNLRRSVAMKVLHNPGKATRSQLLRFIEEAQVTAQLQHPSIVPTYELGVDASGNPFYTMKMIRGQTLRAILEQIQAGDAKTIEQYPLPRLLMVFQRVCDAMAFSHSKRVIHRDLKPENIMVGEYGETLVMDWGLAKVLPKKDWRKKGGKPSAPVAPVKPITVVESIRSDKSMSGNGVKTMDGMVMGTPQFMAPEQAQGEIEKLDDRTDVYSLGAILYSILTLHPPISGNDIDEMLKNVSQGNIPHPCTYQTGKQNKAGAGANAKPAGLAHCPGGRIPEALIAVTLKAMALQPSDRYPRVIELQRDIEAYQTGFAVSVEQASLRRQLGLLVGRHKGIFAAAGVAVLVLAAVIAVAFARVNREKQRALASEAQAIQALTKYEAEQRLRLAERRESAPGLYNSARVLIGQNDYNEARDLLELALEYDPAYISAVHLLAVLLMKDGRNQEALDALHRFDPGGATRETVDLKPSLHHLAGQAVRSGIASHYDLAGWAVSLDMLALALQFSQSAEERFGHYSAMLTNVWPSARLSLRPGGEIELNLRWARMEVRSLDALKGIPLRSLSIDGCHGVTDLSPLEGMPLHTLTMNDCRNVTDLEPLVGMPLQDLNLYFCNIHDLSMLAGMPLRRLNIINTKVMDLSPLKDLPLEYLQIQPSQLRYGRNVDVLRNLTTLRGISTDARWPSTGLLPSEFWQRYDAGEFR